MKKIEKLILKYGLIFDEETSRTNNDRRYTWNKNNTMITGDVMIDSMKKLRKYCKNMIEQYELFKLCKKQFKQNTRIKNISKDF